jgi:uncharacterized protein (TIGR03067 family)
MKKMVTALVGAFLVFGVLTAGDPPPDAKAVKGEMDKLQGTWKVMSAKAAGKDYPPAALGMDQITFKGDKMILKRGDKEIGTWGFRVDPRGKPPQMDWVPPGDKASWPGIYELKGDELRLCFPLAPKKGQKVKVTISRPENFETKGKPIFLLVARRVKTETK